MQCQYDNLNLDTAEGRRKVMKYRVPLCCDHAVVVEKFIDIPFKRGTRKIFTKCYVPRLNHDDINCKYWKGIVLFNCGYGHYTDRWETHALCCKFSQNGYICIAHDYVGMGKSDGLFGYVQSFEKDFCGNANYVFNYYKTNIFENIIQLISSANTSIDIDSNGINNNSGELSVLLNSYFDFDQQLDAQTQKKERLGEIESNLKFIIENNEFYLCGESMGGAVSILLTLYNDQYNKNLNMNKNNRKQEKDDSMGIIPQNNANTSISNMNNFQITFKGMILVSPMCQVDEKTAPPEIVQRIFLLLSEYFPTGTFIAMENIMDKLTHDEKELHKIYRDNLLMYWLNPRLNLLKECYNVILKIDKHQKDITTPFLIIHGEDDPVTNCQSSQMFYQNTISVNKKDKKFIAYKNAWHQLFRETFCVEQVYQDIFEWLAHKHAKR